MLLEMRHYALIMLHYAAYNSAYKMEFTYKSTYKIEPVGEHCQTEGPPYTSGVAGEGALDFSVRFPFHMGQLSEGKK